MDKIAIGLGVLAAVLLALYVVAAVQANVACQAEGGRMAATGESLQPVSLPKAQVMFVLQPTYSCVKP